MQVLLSVVREGEPGLAERREHGARDGESEFRLLATRASLADLLLIVVWIRAVPFGCRPRRGGSSYAPSS